MQEEHRQTWGSRTAFVMAAVGSAVGLGNLWRFPYVAYENGGGAFLIPWLVALFTAGIPLMILEFAVGYRFQGGAPAAFERMKRGTSWIGWGAMLNGFVIVCYYAVVMAWALCYLFHSFTVAWSSPEAGATGASALAQTKGFFYEKVLALSTGPGDLGGFQWPVLFALIAVWAIIYLIICKGPEVVGKVVMWTVPLPVVLIVIFVIRGLTLNGAMDGLRFYLTPDFTKLTDLGVWRAAYGQIFFSLSVAFGIMVAYARYQKPDEADVNTSAFQTSITNCSISFIAGFAVFTVVGYLAMAAGMPVEDLKLKGPDLAFVTYPAAISLMPLAPLLGGLFFVMLLTLGIDSAFSLVEAVATGVWDYVHLSKARTALIVCAAGLASGLIFTTRAGLYWLDIVDHFANDILLVLFGLLECVAVGWFVGTGKARAWANQFSSRPIGKWWDICIAGITPAVLAVLLYDVVSTSISDPYEGYPQWALWAGGWGVALTVVVASIVLGCVCRALPVEAEGTQDASAGGS